ncbi:hypothetical protein NDA13_006380 [Ustilago tritici]|nr:hypothetical protein NDA13_006380 [Ustilago tritici]
MSTTPYELKWGILATGGIADKFVQDLLIDPSTRDVSDVKHKVVAAASSTSAKRAADFISSIGAEGAQGYGSYQELVKDPEVQMIYPFTINAAQTKHLIKVAREKKLFLMEVVWIRFFPITLEIQRLIHQERRLGAIRRVFFDFGMQFKPDPKHRLFNPELDGGALLDLGIYALTWQMLTLFADPDNHKTAPEVTGSIVKSKLTGVDASTTMVFNFPTISVQGIATTNMTIRSSEKYVVLIQGEKADMTIPWAPYRPESFTIHQKDSEGVYTGKKEDNKFDIPGHGMFWEADACARAIRDGKMEEEKCSWAESTLTMEIMDKVRYGGGVRYPDHIEAVHLDA